MRVGLGEEIIYPSKQDILDIHSDIVSEDKATDTGTLNDGNVDFTLSYITYGYYGECPETIHEKATHLMRLLAANHSFADGNKRTALNTTWTFYFMNGYYFNYGEEIKAILKLYAVMEEMVDTENVHQYFDEITIPIEESTAVSDEIRTLFEYYREVVSLLDEIEKTIEDIDDIQTLNETINKTQKATDLFESIGELVTESDSEDLSIFKEALQEEIQRTRDIISELDEIADKY